MRLVLSTCVRELIVRAKCAWPSQCALTALQPRRGHERHVWSIVVQTRGEGKACMSVRVLVTHGVVTTVEWSL